ncbi:hypothetical protein SAMN04487944_12121 [Gracilibacillus ureilyticus]|uniref:CAAX prenyl protease 2/Lysostaphin resistance protein A-like domain-containing protein n=1 Tax=Gracilibacillus ureilyticus TaxID=531814 RepID=A0A1H9V3A9_9BACI|nr:CPBP family intramembrane glutamic endopeptidase [Gracilibacillus ureilyticus]SES16162.1 hypothetical protein SAMN04487944_12121 [Gracilibacillus ureilyticus]
MKNKWYRHSGISYKFTSLFFFVTLLALLQLKHYGLAIATGFCLLLFFFNKSMKLFVLSTLAFGAGFFIYSYVTQNLLTDTDDVGTSIIQNRLALFFIIIPLILTSLFSNLPFTDLWRKPDWGAILRIPLPGSHSHQVKVSVFLPIAMITNMLVFLPFIIMNGPRLEEIWLFALSFALINAMLEEIIWRGLLLSHFTRALGSVWAVIITSAGFGLQHYSLGFSWGASIAFIAGGLFFGAVTVRSNSIFPAVIWHVFINVLMVLSGLIR